MLGSGKPGQKLANIETCLPVGSEPKSEPEPLPLALLAVGVDAKTALEKDFSWDGEDTPVMVMFFVERDGKIEPI